MKNKKDRIYIAYGSNLNLPQMMGRCDTAEVLGAGKLDGYEIVFRGGRGGGVATIEPKEGGSVPVLLWTIQKQDESSLDRYEGWPYFYRKEMIDVEMEGKSVSGMVYVMNDGHEAAIPSKYYYNTIAEGYEDAGFDLGVLKQAVERTKEVMRQESEQGESPVLHGNGQWSGFRL